MCECFWNQAKHWDDAKVRQAIVLHPDHLLVDIRSNRLSETIWNELAFGD
jgi:uncharacterized protein YozE (UPF0346 family)